MTSANEPEAFRNGNSAARHIFPAVAVEEIHDSTTIILTFTEILKDDGGFQQFF